MSDLNAIVRATHPVTFAQPISRLTTDGQAGDAGGRSHDQMYSRAKCVVAEYLRDLGLRDPDVVAKECQRIVAQAQDELPPGRVLDETSLCATAIRLTVKQLERWFAVLAAQSGRSDEPKRLGSVVAARLPRLLDQFPHALNQTRLPAELVGSLQDGLAPVVPPPRPRRMRRQMLSLVPPSWKRLMSQVHKLFFGRAS